MAASKAASYCAHRERTAQDVLARLSGYGLSEEEQGAVVAKLRENDFINEGRYASAFASDRFRFNRWGRNKIRHALQMKKIAESSIERAIESLPQEEYRSEARNLIRTKMERLSDLSPYERKAKVAQYLIGKGYEADMVYSLIDEIERR